MPFAEFQPSDAGERVNRQILDNVSFGVSLMERAQRYNALQQDTEQKAKQFVTNQMLDNARLYQMNLQATQMEGEQRIAAKKREADLSDMNSRIAENEAAQTNRASSSKLYNEALTNADSYIARMKGAGSLRELNTALTEFQANYGSLIKDPAVGSRYAAIEGRIAAEAAVKHEVFASRIDSASADLGARLDGTPESLAAVRQSPDYALARQNPEFAKRVDAEIKNLQDHRQKIEETRAAEEAKAYFKTPEKLPQFLFEKMGKIAQAKGDLDAVRKAYGDGKSWGPLISPIRRMINTVTGDNISLATLDAAVTAMVPNLARGVFGEVGVLTDADIQNYKRLLPTSATEPEVAQALIKMLEAKLQSTYSDTVSKAKGQGYSTSGFSETLGPAPTPVTGAGARRLLQRNDTLKGK